MRRVLGVASVRNNVVGLVWLAGIALALLVYWAGPDTILYGGIQTLEDFRRTLNGLLAAFAVDTYDVMRALTLGLLPAFLALGVLAHRRGHSAVRPVVLVAVLLLLLLYQPAREGFYVSSTRWTIAFFAVAVGCAVLTQRLTSPPRGWRAGAVPPPDAGAAGRWTRPLG